MSTRATEKGDGGDGGKQRNANYDVRSAQVPREFFPTGRIKFSLGVPVSSEQERAASAQKKPPRQPLDLQRRGWMDLLRTHYAWDVLAAIQNGRIPLSEVCRRIKARGESEIKSIQLELRAAEDHDSAPEEPTPTFGMQADSYLTWYGANKEPGSYETRASKLRRVRQQTRADGTKLDDVPFDQLMSTDIKWAIDGLGGKPNTREGYRTAVSAVYTWHIRTELEAAEAQKREPRWNRNPAALVDVEVGEPSVAPATEDHIVALLRVAEPYQDAYVRSLVHLGLREGELQHVRFGEDLDLDRWIVRIQKRGPTNACSCRKCKKDGWKPKNTNGKRSLHIPPAAGPLRQALLNMLEMYPVKLGDFAFRNPRTDRIWNVKSLQTDFARLCELAGVPYGRDNPDAITIHSLRHSCATNLVRAGVPLKVAADILGDTVETIEKYYVRLDEHDLGRGIGQAPQFEVPE